MTRHVAAAKRNAAQILQLQTDKIALSYQVFMLQRNLAAWEEWWHSHKPGSKDVGILGVEASVAEGNDEATGRAAQGHGHPYVLGKASASHH